MSDGLWAQLQRSVGNGIELIAELGGGGMSRVFRARDLALNRDIVVKVLPPELAGSVSSSRFRQEIRLAATLQHPLVVPVLTSGEMDGLPWYTMPFVEGDSLRARLKREHGNGLPIVDVISILRDVARALDFAHGRQVVHRDVKPDNVLLSHGTAALTDFGVARAVALAGNTVDGTRTGTGTALGTPAYMAPEQIAADPALDHRVDLYAFGVMAYEMLSGGTPFEERSLSAQLTAKLTELPPPLKRRDVPSELSELLFACLALNPDDRPATAHEVVEQLEKMTGRSDVNRLQVTAADARGLSRRTSMMLAFSALALFAVVFALRDQIRHGLAPARPSLLPPEMMQALLTAPAERDERRKYVEPSEKLVVFGAGLADPASRGPGAELDSIAAMLVSRLQSLRVMRVEAFQPTRAPIEAESLRVALADAGARFGVVPWVRVSNDAVVSGATVVDLGPSVGAQGSSCDVRGRSVTRGQRADAILDFVDRLHGMFAVSFDPASQRDVAVSTHVDALTGKVILACRPDGFPISAVAAWQSFASAQRRGDQGAAVAILDSLIALDISESVSRRALGEKMRLTRLGSSATLVAYDALNPPPPADARPERRARYRMDRASLALNIREELAVARELHALVPGQRHIVASALVASDRPTEALAMLDAEIASWLQRDSTESPRPNHYRWLSSLRSGRLNALWLLENDRDMLFEAAKILSDSLGSALSKRTALPYVLHSLLAVGDTASWRAVFRVWAPDAPSPRAALLATHMHFTLTRGDTETSRALAEEIVRDYERLLGQRDVPPSLAIPVAQAHRRLGNLERAATLLQPLDASGDRFLVVPARQELILVAAERQDELAVLALSRWVNDSLSLDEPGVALLTLARLRAVQGNLPDAWRYLQEYAALGLTRWQAEARTDPDLSRLRNYEPARVFFQPHK